MIRIVSQLSIAGDKRRPTTQDIQKTAMNDLSAWPTIRDSDVDASTIHIIRMFSKAITRFGDNTCSWSRPLKVKPLSRVAAYRFQAEPVPAARTQMNSL